MTSIPVPIPLGWKVIVKPKVGKTTTDSGIDISAGKDAEDHLNYIGEIVAVGEAAFSASTKGGIDMAQWEARPQVGDWVMFTPYAGMRIRIAGGDETKVLILMNDTDIHALIEDPNAYYSWIDVGNG
jgi:co-chaperonin GroES (HSP10)